MRKCTIISDSMAKYVTGINSTKVVPFPGINVSRLTNKIRNGVVDMKSKYVILHVGTNDVNTLTASEICSSFNDLITTIRQNYGCKILISSILPRPIDFEVNGMKIKEINKALERLCKERQIQFVPSYRPFLKEGLPRRDLFAIWDGGLHLNLEGTRRLRHVFISLVQRLK